MEAKRVKAKAPVRAANSSANRPFYVAIGVLLIVGIAYLSYMSSQPKGVSYLDTSIAPIANTGHVIGSDSAPVEVIEFGDFECAACGSFANLTEPDVRARLVLTGKVRFRFMDNPLSGHRYTGAGHMAAWCAGEQGKFWEMHDAIYQNQDRWARPRPERVLSQLAQTIGVGMEQYDACITTGKYAAQIKANSEEGGKRGVNSTPTFFFGRKTIAYVVSYDEFKANVDTMLAAAKAAPATKKK